MRPLRIISSLIFAITVPFFILLMLRAGKNIDNENDLTQGRWTRSSNVDWCEPNYIVTSHIAEFFNSMSSLIIVVSGMYGLYKHWNTVETRYLYAFTIITVVGLGSSLFHGTLMREWQLADELPMVWGNGIFVYCILTMEDSPEWKHALVIKKKNNNYIYVLVGLEVISSFAITYLDSKDQTIFLFCYSSGALYIMYKNYQLDFNHNRSHEIVFFDVGMICYIGGLFVWLIDRLYCSSVVFGIPIQKLHLHSFWHVFAGSGTYLCVLFWIWTRGKVLKRKGMAEEGSRMLPMSQWISFDEVKVV